MKRRFKTNKEQTAVKGTYHVITTANGIVIHKNLASNPIKF